MLTKEKTGLIVVDIQGKLARLVHDSSTLIPNCEKLIKGVQSLGLPILWLEQNPDKIGSTVEELASILANRANRLSKDHSQDAEHASSPITKFSFDACANSQFLAAIKASKVDTWLVCGIETHICVYQTASSLKAMGFNVQLVSDCVSSRTLANKELGITKLVNQGVELTGLEMCLFELVQDCRNDEFKEILNLIK